MDKCLLQLLLSIFILNLTWKLTNGQNFRVQAQSAFQNPPASLDGSDVDSRDGQTPYSESNSDDEHNRIKRIPIERVERSLENQITIRKRAVVAQSAIDPLTQANWTTTWVGLITIGTPPQPFYVRFDTSSSDLWVEGVKCGNLCGGNNTYKNNASSTYTAWNKGFYLRYRDGSSVNGTWANDTVKIGNISIAHQPFGVASSAIGMNSSTSDGVLGLAYPQLAVGGETPVVWALYQSGQLQQPIFCFWFGATSTGTNVGELILGGYDTSKFTGSITYVPVSVKGYWEFVANSVVLTVGTTKTTIASSINAILDTSTPVAIAAPTTYANQMNAIIGATYDATSKKYVVNCQNKTLSSFPNITITINNTPFTLTPLMYILITGGPTQYKCYSMITPTNLTDSNKQPVWILGDDFMARFYSVFDMQNNRVGLALSSCYSSVQIVPHILFNPNPVPVLPPQCYNYRTVNDPTRLTTEPAGSGCDTSCVFNSYSAGSPTYVRFVSPGGTRLATSPVNGGNGFACGTYASGWTNSTYPSVVGSTTYVIVCFAYNGNACFGNAYWLPIINCGGYYVHGLYSPGGCAYRYCTQ